MNDFTKEELETILHCVGVVSHHEDNDESALFDKIQSMVESYCEHTLSDGSGSHVFCTKCQDLKGKK